MSNTGKHFRNRHGGDSYAGGGVRSRDTHGMSAFSPSVDGMSYSDARDGEQSQTPDLAPGSVDGSIIGDAVIRASHIVPETLSLDLFAETIRPPSIVDTLPVLPDASYIEGQLAFLTTDGKLYRNVADVWTVEVDGADILANSITAGQIAAGAIATDELAAGAITTEKFHVGAQAPGVANNPADPPSSEVLIDSDGITILNGKIFLRDESGRSVLAPAGFGGSWLDFLKTHVYNGTFSAGAGANVVPPNEEEVLSVSDLPYWDVLREGVTNTESFVYHGSADDADFVMEARLEVLGAAAVGEYIQIEQTVPLSASIARRGFGHTGAIAARVVYECLSVAGTITDYQMQVTLTQYGLTGVNAIPVPLGTPTTSAGGLAFGIAAEVQPHIGLLDPLCTHIKVEVRLIRVANAGGGTSTVKVAVRNVTLYPSVAELYLNGVDGNGASQIRQLLSLSGPQLVVDPDVEDSDVTNKQLMVRGSLKAEHGLLALEDDVQLSRGAANRLDLASGDTFNIVSGALMMGSTTTGRWTGYGTAFPGSPVDGDRYYRTDLKMGFVYGSGISRWLSEQRFSTEFTGVAFPLAASNTLWAPTPFSTYAEIYVDSCEFSFYQASVSGGNYWTYNFYTVDSGGAGTVLLAGGGNSLGVPASTWARGNYAVGALKTNAIDVFQFTLVKVGSPGACYAPATINWRASRSS